MHRSKGDIDTATFEPRPCPQKSPRAGRPDGKIRPRRYLKITERLRAKELRKRILWLLCSTVFVTACTSESGDESCVDNDQDGFGQGCAAGPDCDDSSAAINPDAPELCNGADDNCNNEADEGLAVSDYYPDGDSDGYGDPASEALSACEPPEGYVEDNRDCDDDNSNRHPDADELCNELDDDCDDQVDEDLVFSSYYVDGDGDGFGDQGAEPLTACVPPAGHAGNSSDCDDDDDQVHPGAAEVCNGVDDNCAGGTDEGVTTIFYIDSDNDGYGDPDRPEQACEAAEGLSDNGDDCDDGSRQVHPGAAEVCNGVDDNCAQGIDEGVTATYYTDSDDDGYGDAANPVHACGLEEGITEDSSDCDDNDLERYQLLSGHPDLDRDGYGADDSELICSGDSLPPSVRAEGGDCDDMSPHANPGGFEIPADGVDQDCSGSDLLPSNDNGIFVAMGYPEDNPGTMEAPCGTLAAGLARAEEAALSALYIASGSYEGGVTTAVSLFGGFDETSWDRDAEVHLTEIVAPEDVALSVVAASDDDWVLVDGLTIVGAEAESPRGIFVDRGHLQVSACHINGGRTTTDNRFVAAIFGLDCSSIVAVGNMISGGSGTNTKGIDSRCDITAIDNEIWGGTATRNAEGVVARGATAVLINNRVDCGVADSWCYPLVAHNPEEGVSALVGNAFRCGLHQASGMGPYLGSYGHTYFINNIIEPGQNGSAISSRGGTATFVGNNIWSPSLGTLLHPGAVQDIETFNACETETCIEALGNISVDPGLDSDGFHLLAGSPCIDSGFDPVSWSPFGLDGLDIDGQARPQGDGWDIGPDEVLP